MIWADRAVVALWFCYAAFIFFTYAHGDMTGASGALLAILWGTLYLALPAWIVLRAINYVLLGNRFRNVDHDTRPAFRVDR